MWPWEGAVREEMLPHSGKPLQRLGISRDTGSFRGLEESAVAALCVAGGTETCTDGPGRGQTE